MELFIIIEEGVYRHDILGIFDNVEKAKNHAKSRTKKSDGYHAYNVCKIELNTRYKENGGELIKWYQNIDGKVKEYGN